MSQQNLQERLQEYSTPVGTLNPEQLLNNGLLLIWTHNAGMHGVMIFRCSRHDDGPHFHSGAATGVSDIEVTTDNARDALASFPYDYSQFRYMTPEQAQQFELLAQSLHANIAIGIINL